MTVSSLLRASLSAATAAAFAVGVIAGPAGASERRRGDEELGAAVALGIGALVIGGILANKSRGDRHRDVRHQPQRYPHYEQPRYSHPAPHVNRAPQQPYLNDGH